MRTTKPISTIAYNSTEFLCLKLEELRRAGRLSFWAVIWHQSEDDESGKKDHHHVYVEPAKMLQSDDLKKELIEPVHGEKPLGCISWVSSKFADWYLYVLHDKAYLASKNQSRKFHYSHDCILSSDADDLLFKVRSIDMLSVSPYAAMLEAQEQGLTFQEYFRRGNIPIPQLHAWEHAWSLLACNVTDRNGRPGHE